MKTITITQDPDVWAEVPMEYPVGPYATQTDWALGLADAYSVGRADPEAVKAGLFAIASALPVGPRLGLFEVLWYRPAAERMPLLVNVYVAPGKEFEGVALTELAGAYEPEPARPPIVDTLESGVFSSAARVLSFTKDERRDRLLMHLSAVGRYEDVLVRIDAYTNELGHGTAAVDDFTALLETFSFGDAPDPSA
ncbi:MAG: hypothetical protein ABI130_16740 [Leifsonia sp.]